VITAAQAKRIEARKESALQLLEQAENELFEIIRMANELRGMQETGPRLKDIELATEDARGGSACARRTLWDVTDWLKGEMKGETI